MTQKNENDVLSKQINKLAFEGQWEPLLQLLELYPSLINVASESKGYTPLHQAA